MKTDVPLERTQQGGDVRAFGALSGVRQKKNMHVVRNHHVSDEAYVEPRLQRFQRGDDGPLRAAVMEETGAAIAGDHPEVDVTGLVESF